MKLKLFEFQDAALELLREKVLFARAHSSISNPQAIAFSAPTGSGKTIVMTSLFEDIFYGHDTLPAQDDAVILWVSDMPELNEQTRRKIEWSSDRIRTRQLVSIDSSFDAQTLTGGQIYFVNTQKLGADKLLTKEGDGRKFSVWSTFANTARAAPDRFYVVIDEAHRGMATGKLAAEAQTIMQRFILGFPEANVPMMPLVIGMSATPRRFMNLLEHAPHTVHKVAIPSDEVRESGLLKDRILIHHPQHANAAEMSLLEQAAIKWGRLTDRWGTYCNDEAEQRVWPILVVQIENGTNNSYSKTDLQSAVAVIEKAIDRRLNESEVAHAMHDVGDLDVGGRLVRKVDASRISENREIGVVFFKTNLSTGWDCPRAEVMMSFRRAEDHTYIAQLLGRMVRTPLARRIERDAELNDVHLYVPYFDKASVDAVVADLQNVEEVPPSETGSSSELVVLGRRDGSGDLFTALENLVTYRVRAARSQSNVKRYLGLARGLTIDGLAAEAWDDARTAIIGQLDAEVAKLQASGDLEAQRAAVQNIALRTVTVQQGVDIPPLAGDYQIPISDIDLDRLFEAAGRSLGNGLHVAYWEAHDSRPDRDVKSELIIVSGSHASMIALEAVCELAFNRLYDEYKGEIWQLKEHRRVSYEKLRLATAKPSDIPWVLPETLDFKRSETAPELAKHIFVEADGEFRADFGSSWERDLIEGEIAQASVIGWFRNVDRKPWSLEVPYRTGGVVRAMFPDFITLHMSPAGAVLVDILEPHDPSLADNFEKAIGLAEFAEKHGHLFRKIEMIRKMPSPAGGETFRRLNVNALAVQNKVKLITSNPQLDALFASDG
ncbi:MAG TPA: DEAD/DEAH box helicase family protein [Pyrinomonadaceae bacterium]|nr:DEAD/DEAH box helicase family protein [Pyrinomonadaceae bacterium]